jgi:hypothetical protein
MASFPVGVVLIAASHLVVAKLVRKKFMIR